MINGKFQPGEGSLRTGDGLGIYIHIPFCKQKCNYCDFLSFPSSCRGQVADYLLGLKKEIQLAAAGVDRAEAASVYLGGGTPSLLSSQALKEIFSALRENFSLSSETEITIEANPGTLSREKLRAMAALGVNRLSLGVQSLEDAQLSRMGRVHTAEEAREAFRLARQEGFHNINVDLIHGLPGQTPAAWVSTLREAAELAPEHVSAYGLSLEKGTPWGDLNCRGELALPSEGDCARMYGETGEVLSEWGFIQYEISNYAKPGYESKHNLGYWLRRPYLGIGLGASSFINETRYRNCTQLSDYLSFLEINKLPIAEAEKISREEAMSETMFLGLRTARGVNILEFVRQYGLSVEQAFPAVKQLEQAGVLRREGSRLTLNPDYYGVSNEIFLRFV